MSTVTRPATVMDVPDMLRLINSQAELGLMLSKDLATLYENVREFRVATNESGEIIGVCGLSIIWGNLAEIISLTVTDKAQGTGIGSQLVQSCLDNARELGIRKIITLTYRQSFFENSGFVVVDRMTLPHKVWSQCIHCPKHDACDEIAMLRILEDVADTTPPAAPPSMDNIEAPVPLTHKGKPTALP